MEDKTKRNELLITLADVNSLIGALETKNQYEKEATETINQLLYAYNIKVKILNSI